MSITDLNEALDKAERGILNFFLPRRCPFCGAVTGKALLCDKCEKSLPYTGERAVEEAGFARCAAPLYYDGSVRKAILDFKFGRKMGAVSCFGQMMAQCAAAFERLPVLENADLLRNILYSGVWMHYRDIRHKRAEKEESEGENH